MDVARKEGDDEMMEHLRVAPDTSFKMSASVDFTEQDNSKVVKNTSDSKSRAGAASTPGTTTPGYFSPENKIRMGRTRSRKLLSRSRSLKLQTNSNDEQADGMRDFENLTTLKTGSTSQPMTSQRSTSFAPSRGRLSVLEKLQQGNDELEAVIFKPQTLVFFCFCVCVSKNLRTAVFKLFIQ